MKMWLAIFVFLLIVKIMFNTVNRYPKHRKLTMAIYEPYYMMINKTYNKKFDVNVKRNSF